MNDTKIWQRMILLSHANGFWCGMAALMGVFIFTSALAMQHWMQLEPCPLCIFQRVALLAATVAAALSFLLSRFGWSRSGKSLTWAAVVLGLAGLAIALRHMYVMWVPQAMGCGPGLEYMMESFPPSKWLPKVFAGESECAEAAKHLILGLPIPVWSALGFLAQLMVLSGNYWSKTILAYISRTK